MDCNVQPIWQEVEVESLIGSDNPTGEEKKGLPWVHMNTQEKQRQHKH